MKINRRPAVIRRNECCCPWQLTNRFALRPMSIDALSRSLALARDEACLSATRSKDSPSATQLIQFGL
jgi:hypothetical protein